MARRAARGGSRKGNEESKPGVPGQRGSAVSRALQLPRPALPLRPSCPWALAPVNPSSQVSRLSYPAPSSPLPTLTQARAEAAGPLTLDHTPHTRTRRLGCSRTPRGQGQGHGVGTQGQPSPSPRRSSQFWTLAQGQWEPGRQAPPTARDTRCQPGRQHHPPARCMWHSIFKHPLGASSIPEQAPFQAAQIHNRPGDPRQGASQPLPTTSLIITQPGGPRVSGRQPWMQ